MVHAVVQHRFHSVLVVPVLEDILGVDSGGKNGVVDVETIANVAVAVAVVVVVVVVVVQHILVVE